MFKLKYVNYAVTENEKDYNFNNYQRKYVKICLTL